MTGNALTCASCGVSTSDGYEVMLRNPLGVDTFSLCAGCYRDEWDCWEGVRPTQTIVTTDVAC